MDQDILREYLGTRRKEVVTMMMDLYDQDRIMEIHIASERKIAAEEAAEKEKEQGVKRLLKLGKLSVEEIADCQSVPVQRVREIEESMLQEA